MILRNRNQRLHDGFAIHHLSGDDSGIHNAPFKPLAPNEIPYDIDDNTQPFLPQHAAPTPRRTPMPLKIRVQTIEGGVMPSRILQSDAAFDCFARKITHQDNLVAIDLGFRIAIPKGYFGDLRPRSSVIAKNLHLANSCGVIDSGYRGEVRAVFYKTHAHHNHHYQVGDRVAQLIIQKLPSVRLVESKNLDLHTDRGQRGFGSTGD